MNTYLVLGKLPFETKYTIHFISNTDKLFKLAITIKHTNASIFRAIHLLVNEIKPIIFDTNLL